MSKRVTEEIVHEAAAILDAEGKKPTTIAIRDKLGYGSYTTIQRFLASYDSEAVEGPDTLPDAPTETIETLWRLAYTAAWTITRTEVENLTEHREVLMHDLDQAVENIDAISRQRDELKHKLATLEQLRFSEAQTLDALQADVLTWKTRAQTLEETLAQLSKEKGTPAKPAPKRRTPANKAPTPDKKATAPAPDLKPVPAEAKRKT